MNKHLDIATDWDAIYTKQLKECAEARYKYDVLQGNGIGAYDELQKQKLNKLHQFFVNFEKKCGSKKTPVRFIG